MTRPKGKAKRRAWGWSLLGWLLLFGALGIVPATLVSLQEQQRLAEIPHWPTTPGTVLSATVEWQPSRSHRDYFARIQYTYVVDRVSHSSRNVGYSFNGGDFGRDADAARAFAAGYPVGSTVTVHYDPKDPESAVLFPGDGSAGKSVLVLLAVAGIAELGGAIACFAVAKRRRRATA